MASSIYGKYTKESPPILRLVTYAEPNLKIRRTGFVVGNKVVDVNVASRFFMWNDSPDLERDEFSSYYAPTDMLTLVRRGEGAVKHLDRVFRYFVDVLSEGRSVRGPEGENFVFDLGQVEIKAPLRPGKFIHTAGNFREHAQEGKEAGWPFPIPQWISFLKNPDAVIGHDDNIVKPHFVKQLDHELELAIVIGRKVKNVEVGKAFSAIFGFTIFNDVTARDIQREEMKNGLLNFGKNLDTFTVLGPAIVPKEYIGDVHNLAMELRVNGDPRQVGSTSRLSVKIEEIVSRYSWVTLNPGDMISTGTISGVAAFRKPDPTPFFLKDGDVLECEIEKIGLMRNKVVDEK